MKPLGIVLALSLAVILLPPPAAGQEPVQFDVVVQGRVEPVTGSPSDHFLTFSLPVQVPGVSLSPGAYIFRIIQPSVVQVLSADREQIYAMFFTIPTTRARATSRDELTFTRIRDDAPPRIASWFLRDTTEGREPIYPDAAPAPALAMR